jgi:LPXTG-site transpeptidase (sortase) family protein
VIDSISPASTITGEPYQVTVSVNASSPGTGAPTGGVTVIDGEGNTCIITLSDSSGSCEMSTFSIGSKNLTASYSGDSDFNACSNSTTHAVTIASTTTTITSDDPDPSAAGEDVLLQALVAPVSPATGTPTGDVSFFSGTTLLCTASLSAGTAQCSTSTLNTGNHTLSAEYSGDADTYAGSISANEEHSVQSITLSDNKTSTSFTDVGEFSNEGVSGPFTYSLQNSGRYCSSVNGADNDRFTIFDSTLQRKSDTPAGTYSICVESVDADSGSIQMDFEIVINNPPSLNEDSLDHQTVSGTQTQVGLLTPTDGQEPLSISLGSSGSVCNAENSSGNAYFQFDGGYLRRNADTPVGEYSICVQVIDAENEIAQYVYPIKVTNPPNSLSLSSNIVSTAQSVVGQFDLEDGQSPFTFRLADKGELCTSSNSSGNESFTINGNDLERKATTGYGSYAICVEVEDDNALTTQNEFTIFVTDPPSDLSLSNDSVSTNQTNIGMLDTSDGQNPFEYSFKNSGSVCNAGNAADNDLFLIEGNTLKRKSDTDAGIYDICIQTQDANSETFQKTFNILVSFEEPSALVWDIALTSNHLIEGDGPGTIVGSLTSTIPGTIFTIIDSDKFPLSDNFRISENGELILSAALDYAITENLPLRIQATSPDGDIKTLDVIVTVMENGVLAGAMALPDEARVITTGLVEVDVLSNDTFSEGASEWAKLEIVRYPLHGEAHIGSIIYKSDAFWSGEDSLTYRACDDLGKCVTAEVTVSVFLAPEVPATGFPADVATSLPIQPEDKAYSTLNDLQIEIPKLSIQSSILGVPISEYGWDITWLGDNVGWLNGSAYPTWEGNSILTGHIYDTLGNPGIFHDLKDLNWGDEVLIHLDGQTYTYEVREVLKQISPQDVDTLTKHKDGSWLSLVTCQGFDQESASYNWRLIIRAALVSVE